jgi:hypothetical protein
MIAGLPGAGLSTLFYAVLLLGIGVARIWRGTVRFARQIGRRYQAAHRQSFVRHREHPKWGETARREHRA